ncbi:MAG: cation:dicarboxylase symporter family transporter [Ekhidna sp.]|nr:cation:dicarboxylase symporter family transporter [Ekhidna sp.]
MDRITFRSISSYIRGGSIFIAFSSSFRIQVNGEKTIKNDDSIIISITALVTTVTDTAKAGISSSAGLVMMIIVLQSVGLNPAWIAIIFPVDRIPDMCRTVVNVTGDATVATLVASTEGELSVGGD